MSLSIQGKRVFITGATGFIGRHIARRMHGEGAHVLALERTKGKGDDLRALGIEVVEGDVTDHKKMSEIIRNDVQIVMHIAGWLLGSSAPANAKRINVDATKHLAEEASKAHVERFVFTSTVGVYGLMGDNNVDESTPLAPFGDPYGDTKILAEEVIREVSQKNGLSFCIVRPGVTYGPEAYDWSVRPLDWAKNGKVPLIDGGRGTFYPVYIDDLVDLMMLCALHPKADGQVFNGLADGPVTRAEFFGAYMKMVPTDSAKRIPGWLVKALGSVLSPFIKRVNLKFLVDQQCGTGWISNQKAKERLDWKPAITLDEGMMRTEEWLRAEGYLPARAS